ncbi:hypothetical protein PTKIN_Ptkin16aG0099300 [Pterospermum kingtungense]
MDIEKQREIQHSFHEHPLVWVEEQSNQTENAYCFGCGEAALGPFFSCFECKYHLHQQCAEAPDEIRYHPLHRRHSGFFLRERPLDIMWYACALCKEKRDMFFYECNVCCFSFDIKCAFLFQQKVGENFLEFKDEAFQLLISSLANNKGEFHELYCFMCHEPFVDSLYASFDFKIYLHDKCLESAIETDHPCHRIHTLTLQFSEKKCFCIVCQKEDDKNFFYHCFACKFEFHPQCVWPRPIIEDEKYHEHPFTLLWKQDHPFICNACGIEGNYFCYTCSTCHLLVHKHCTSLPQIIKVTGHNHLLQHKFFLKKREHERYECQICFDEVKAEYGSYQCLKKDCNYTAHVNCSIENDDLYYTVTFDREKQVEEPDEAMGSSIRVIKKNEHGEVTIVKHFCHEHNLLLEDKVKEENGINCDGCMLTISIPFYYCSECNFYLHKTCAELPKAKHHWFHRFVATLQSYDFMDCKLCGRHCSGLFYKSISHDVIFLFCLSSYGAFRCKKCSFALDFACLTLPYAFQHNCDPHWLQLAFADENDDVEQHYCDICEEKRDPTHWYYHCSTCDTSAHSECVLGKFPFIKDGNIWPSYNHPHYHKLTFVRKVDGYPYISMKIRDRLLWTELEGALGFLVQVDLTLLLQS